MEDCAGISIMLAQIAASAQDLAASGSLSVSQYGADPLLHWRQSPQHPQGLLCLREACPDSSTPAQSPLKHPSTACTSADSPASSMDAACSVTTTPLQALLLPCSPMPPCGSSAEGPWAPFAGAQEPSYCATADTPLSPRLHGAFTSSSSSPAGSYRSARRCLCLALENMQQGCRADAATPALGSAAGQSSSTAAGDSCSTPRAAMMVPAACHPPPAPRATSVISLHPLAKATVTAAATATVEPAGSTLAAQQHQQSAACSCVSTGNHSRVQQWLAAMELKLQVPPAPMEPPVEPCLGPGRGLPAATATGCCAPALTQPLRLLERTSTAGSVLIRHPSSASSSGDDQMVCGLSSAAAGRLCSGRVLPSLSPSAAAVDMAGSEGGGRKKRALATWDALSLSGKRQSVPAAVRACSISCLAVGPDDGPAAALQAAQAPAEALPAPAFVVLGLLSNGGQLP